MDKCPKCGGTSGFCTKGVVWQYYKCNGEPDGYDFGSEGAMATCLDCGGRTKLTKILTRVGKAKFRVGDTVFAVVKNDKFQLEVVEATLVYADEKEVRLERPRNALVSDGWVFPTEALEREVFTERKLADSALFRMLAGKEG